MNWNNKRYHTINYDLQDRFGDKVIKLAINAGMTCPNRDGSIGSNGCLFCGEAGAGDFAGDVNKTITDQMSDQVLHLKEKWPNGKYIAYFQSYTNTYGDVEELRAKFEEALAYENVVGIAIATRPDCLEDPVIDLLTELNERTFLWLELGLQSMYDSSGLLLRRGYDLEVYEKIHQKLKKAGIREVIHLIVGVPGEDYNMIMNSTNYVANLGIYGVKIHLLHVLKNTDLQTYYNTHKFKLLDQETYINWVVDMLEKLPPNMTIHRVTGDGKKDLLIGPWWSLNKRSVLNGIDKELKRRDSYQGKHFNR